jgi:hypothetical protein
MGMDNSTIKIMKTIPIILISRFIYSDQLLRYFLSIYRLAKFRLVKRILGPSHCKMVYLSAIRSAIQPSNLVSVSYADKIPYGNRPFFLFVNHVLTLDRILWLISSIFPSTPLCTISIITIYWLILLSAVVTSTILVLSFFFHFTFLSLLINIPLFFET